MQTTPGAKTIQKTICIGILLGTVLAALKLIFVELCQDEEYQIVMAYRRVVGDQLFSTMWEPHQMSSFLNAGLIRIYMLITGNTDGLIVYLRIMGTVLQAGIAWFCYITAKRTIDSIYALFISVVWFNSSMGLFITAEYSSMIMWFCTLGIVLLWNAVLSDLGSRKWLFYVLLADISLCLAILAYPALLLFVAIIWVIAAIHVPAGHRIKVLCMLILPCVFFGICYVSLHVAQVSLPTFLENFPHIFLQDPTHEISKDGFWVKKILDAGKDLLFDGMAATLVYGLAHFLMRKKSVSYQVALASILSLCIPLFRWLILREGFECGHVEELVAGIGLWILLRNYREKDRVVFLWCLYGGVLMIFAGWLFSNMSLDSKLCFGIFLHVGLLLMLIRQMQTEMNRRFLYTVIVIWIFFLIFGKGFMLRSGREYNNLFAVANVCRTGPAKGLVTDYMNAYIMDANYAEWAEYVRQGDHVLIVSQTLQSNVILSYLFTPVEISHCAVNNPYQYSDRLLEYWEEYPDKYPDVIAVDCWYGEEQFSPDSWIMQFIQNDFGYTKAQDGTYLRYYRR